MKIIHVSMVNVNVTVISVCLIFFFLHKIMHIHKFIMYRTSYNINIVTSQSACIRWPDVGNGSYCWPNVGVG